MTIPRTPTATYRLQLNRDFGFTAARELVVYLHGLGVSHCYASPYLKARPGSLHGYDIVDHGALNPEIGDSAAHADWVAELAAHDMGHILDMVPNHMAVGGADNTWWLDVLEHGEASAYAAYFDIDWWPVQAGVRGRLILPVLGGHYGAVLERGELEPRYDSQEGGFSIWYGEHRFPLDPVSYPVVLEPVAATLGDEREQDARPAALQQLIGAFRGLPARDTRDPHQRQTRIEETTRLKRELADFVQSWHELAGSIDAALARIARGAGLPSGVLAGGYRRDQLSTLLRHQRARGPAHGATGGVRRYPPTGPEADSDVGPSGPAHRPPGRSARPARLLVPFASRHKSSRRPR